MKLKSALIFLCCACLLCACNKPKTCRGSCPQGQEKMPFPDCSCFSPAPPEPIKADEDLQLQIIKAVIENNAGFIQEQINKNIDINSPLGVSKEENFLSFRASLSKLPILYDNINKYTNDLTVLFIATCSDRPEVFDVAVNAKNVDVNIPSFSNITPYHAALMKGDPNKMKALLAKGAKPDLSSASNDLRRMLKDKNYDAASVLMKYAQDNNISVEEAFPTMSSAIKDGNDKLIMFLVDFGKMNPDSDNPETGRPYVLDIALLGNQDILKMFVSAGAPVDSKDTRGLNAAMLVMRQQGGDKSLPMVSFLLQNGLDPNSQDNRGDSILTYAIATGNLPLVQKVLESGADVNLRNYRGRTPLFSAAESNNIDIVKLLLEYGANNKIKDKNGVTPSVAAVQIGDMEVYDLLESHRPKKS